MDPMDPIDEAARRRPGFTDGTPVALADGQAWTFPRTRLRLTPAPAGDGRHTVSAGRVGLPRFPEWFRILTSPPRTVSGAEYWDARMDAAATLLGLNYELSADELAGLLAWEEGDDDSRARWDAIDAAVLGTGAPKPSSAT